MTAQYAKPPLQPLQFARNGKYPDALLQTEMADLANHLALYQMKEIASFGMTTTIRATASGTDPRWRTRYRSSPNVVGIAAYGMLAQSNVEIPAYALIEFDTTAGSLAGSAELHYGTSALEASEPDDCGFQFAILSDGSGVWTPTADTIYDVTVNDVDSRIGALTLYEICLNSGPPFSEGYAVQSPILDTDRSELLNAARLMWKRQAAPLFTWTVDDQATPRTRTSTTPINIIDNASTTVTAATVGFTIDLRNRSTQRRTTVPCVFEVYGRSQQAIGGDGSVLLLNSSGTTLATGTLVEAAGTNAWDSVSVDLPATLAKYDIHFAASAGGDTVSLYAVVLRQYASGS
jgi:hypothetical protein